MPFFSYLAIAVPGASEELRAALESTPHCEIIPAEQRDLLILITDAPDEETEERLQQNLKQVKSLQALLMTFGHADEDQLVAPEEPR